MCLATTGSWVEWGAVCYEEARCSVNKRCMIRFLEVWQLYLSANPSGSLNTQGQVIDQQRLLC